MRIQSVHVEIMCVVLILLGIFVLDVFVLPRTPEDAFTTTSSTHAVYEGYLASERSTKAGWMYQGTICKDIQVWSEEKLSTNESVHVTGSMEKNTLFVKDVAER